MTEPHATAATLIGLLRLQPHPEGGWYAEIHRSAAPTGSRGAVSAIYYLLQEGERPDWHRIDATEIWHHYAGAPLELSTWSEGGPVVSHRLGADMAAGERPQAVVLPDVWQAARPLGGWALLGCTVAPAFVFSGFELAGPDWQPAD